MAGQKHIKSIIGEFYRRSAIDIIIFAHISAQRSLVPSLSLDECAQSFQRHYKITDMEMPVSTVKTIFTRVQQDYFKELETKD